jgi:carbon monoxide dehydrogenase subunit G
MELEHSFTVPVPMDRAWDVLLDVERVASCMPGATLDSVDGDEIHGRMKVKVGPISMMYAGTARFVEKDRDAGVVVLQASGKETKGAGTASASIRSMLEDKGDETDVKVVTTLNITGKPAQFGRGVMSEVSGKLLTIFASNLAAMLAQQEAGPAADAEVPAAPPAAAHNGADTSTAGEPTAGEPTAGESTVAEADHGASIDDLGLHPRATSSLQRGGISTVGQLAAKTSDELLTIDGIGPASVTEIETKLAERGMALPSQPATGTTPAAGESAAAAGPASTSVEASAPGAAGAAGAGTAAARAAGVPAPAAAHHATAEAAHQPEDDSINLLKVAGMPVLKRALPVLAGLTAILLIGLRRRLRKRGR